MTTKVEMTVEVLMPTQVTKLVEFPIFVIDNGRDFSWIAITVNDVESKYTPYKIIEVMKWGRSEDYRIYMRDVNDSEIATAIAKLEQGAYSAISIEQFQAEFYNAIQHYLLTVNTL